MSSATTVQLGWYIVSDNPVVHDACNGMGCPGCIWKGKIYEALEFAQGIDDKYLFMGKSL